MEEKLKQLFSHVDLIRVYEYLEHSREANISLLQRYANEKEILEEFIKDISRLNLFYFLFSESSF